MSVRRPPRIVFVTQTLRPYGAERVLARLAREACLERAVLVLTLDAPSDQDLSLPPAVTVRYLRRLPGNVISTVRTILQLRRECREFGAEAVISLLPLANVLTVAALRILPGRRPRLILTEHGLFDASRRNAYLLQAAMRLLYKRADSVVAVSGPVHQHLKKLGIPSVVVDNPVDTAAFHPAHQGRAPRRIICLGRLQESKRQQVLLEALSLPALADFQLVLVGDGPDHEHLRRHAEVLGVEDRVALLGYRDDAPRLLRHAGVLASPSEREGFGLVLVEAALSGLPVVAYANAASSALVPTVVPGLLVQDHEPASWATALRYASEQAGPDLATREELAQRFSPSAVWSAYAELIDH